MAYKIFFLTLCCCFMGCADKQDQKTEVIISDPNVLSPCFNQKWDCGKWIPMQENISDIRFWTIGSERMFGSQFCDACSSIRIIDLKTEQEKLLPSEEYKKSGCSKHTWVAGTTGAASEEDVKCGDAVVVYFNKKLHFCWIRRIDDGEIAVYQHAKLSQNACIQNVAKVKWNKLSWQTLRTPGYLLCGDDLEVPFERYLNLSDQTILGVKYCYNYGGHAWYNAPNPYHIAIIPKADIDKGVIDLTKYRFKTYQDGMGNKCDDK